MGSDYSLETVYQLYSNDTGDAIEIGPDPDGLGCIRIFSDTDYFGRFELTIDPVLAEMMGHALLKASNDVKPAKKGA